MTLIATPVFTNQKQKLAALGDAAKVLEKTFGEGSIMRMGSRKIVPIEVIPTNVFELDNYVIGAGGVPRGRVTEIFGPEGSGKTTWALQTIANAQKAGGTAAFVDAEHALDPNYARKLGVDVDNLFISQPDNGEQALEIVEALIETGAVDVVVVDSVAALVPKSELDGEMSDSSVGVHARLMSKAMRKLTGVTRRTNTALVFINQIREKIGVMFGSPETTTGGRALKFYASLRLDIRRIGQIKEGDAIIGNKTKIKAVKNRLAAPFRECEIELIYGEGIDVYGALITSGVKYGSVEKAGAWYSFQGERLGNGQRNAALALDSSEPLFQKVLAATQKKYLESIKESA